MATLDEKYLDGPNVGYCSDSDEEETRPNFNPGGGSDGPSSFTSPRLGKSVSTGPKGVLADYHQYEHECAAQRQKAELQLIKESKRFTMERGGNRDISDDEKESEVCGNEEDVELDQIRKRRLEQLRNFSRGRIIEIPDTSKFLSVIEGTKDVFIFIHIYRDGLDVAKTLDDALLELAANCKKTAKFFKVKALILGTSGNFTANALPALQIYRNARLIGNFVRITDELGEDFSSVQLRKFLEKHEIEIE